MPRSLSTRRRLGPLTRRLCAILLLLAAGTHTALPASSSRTVEDWMRRLRLADQELRNGQWREGKRAADSVLSEMRERIESGDATAGLLATALLFKAIGEAGSGSQRAAAWDFGIAQTLNSDLFDVDLAP